MKNSAEANARLAEIAGEAMELPVDEREAFVNAACGHDAELLAEVRSLLRFDERARGFIEQSALPPIASAMADDAATPVGQTIAQYRILSLIGRGGMGDVYLAEDPELRRRVALKVVRRGAETGHVIRRFRHEEQILASLNHPNIAHLYGGGVTADGLPFFVMEHVDGIRVDEYCAREKLPLAACLELFRKVCSAVQYAHQHLVVHRDLKPSNILVTSEGEPKLLDFGIAKLLEPHTNGGDLTMTLAPILTPGYASPEHVRGEAVTTASDVYSLGILLYELLTGQKPYRLTSLRPDELARAITEQTPPRPSTAAAQEKASPLSVVANPKSLRGDLDNIVLMALRKEPQRRYSSVAQFSLDLGFHLDGLPVLARKDTVSYRAGKFIMRHKIGVAAAALVLLVLLGGIVATSWQAQNAHRQRDLAQQERARAERISTFLQEMLGAAAPEAKGVEVKVSDVLHEASRRARTQLADQPQVMAGVLMTLGRTCISLGFYDRAEADLRAAVEASVTASGELHPTSASSMAWHSLALAYLGRTDEGVEIGRRSVDLQRRLHPGGHEDLGAALYCLGMNLFGKGEAKAAEPFLVEARDLIRRHLGEDHGYYLATLGALGLTWEQTGRPEAAEALYREAIEKGRNVEGRYRIFLAQASSYLALLLTNKGVYPEADALFRESEAIYRQTLGDSNSNIAFIKLNSGHLHLLAANNQRAAGDYQAACDLFPKFYPPEHAYVVAARLGLGLALTRLGNTMSAEPHLREAIAMRRKVSPAEHPTVASAESSLAECLVVQSRFAEAEPLLLTALERLSRQVDPNDRRIKETRARLVKLYEGWDKPEQAAPFR